ncbi:MAG: aminotransferase class V-fold PLP-dependent enzyme [Kofleriaceae bacterium]
MIQHAIVVANRLVFEGGGSPSLGLLTRTLISLAKIGVTDVCVVDGEHAAELRNFLSIAELSGMRIEVLANRSWRRESGSAILLAREFFAAASGPCLVLRGDRPLDPESLADLAGAKLHDASAIVTIAAPPSGDLGHEVKVRVGKGGEITQIGLDMDRFDAVFTGHMLASRELIDALAGFNNPSMEDALAMWASAGRVRARAGRLAWPWGLPPRADVHTPVNAILSSKSHPSYVLMNPGPVNTTPAVKAAMVHHDVCHRDSNFSELMVSLSGKLRRVFQGTPEHTVCCITGSGTAAMEAALTSTVPYDRKVLVIDNGAFGERLYEICRLHEMEVVRLRYAWGDLVDVADVERAFAEHPDIEVVAMTIHETSVGLLNPATEIGALCRRHDALFLVDAVSALGAEDLDVVRDNIDVCWGSANKCLHAISGVSFVCVSPRTWPKIANTKPRSYYLDLKRYRKYIDDLAQTPFTPAVSAYFALDVACSEFLADGHAKRFAMYRARNRRLRHGLAALGMVPFTRTGKESNSVITCGVPEGIQFDELYTRLKKRGFIVYGCKEVLANRFLQVANMGDMPMEAIEEFLQAAREVIEELRAVPQGAVKDASASRASA